MSVDAGRTWKQTFPHGQFVYDVTDDPRNADVLYVSGFESSAWRSADRGATWTRIPGFNFKWGYRVMPDPFDAKQIFITTFGGGVWHGRFDGDAKAVLDVKTESLRPGGKW
jgi:hypothetical protein